MRNKFKAVLMSSGYVLVSLDEPIVLSHDGKEVYVDRIMGQVISSYEDGEAHLVEFNADVNRSLCHVIGIVLNHEGAMKTICNMSEGKVSDKEFVEWANVIVGKKEESVDGKES